MLEQTVIQVKQASKKCKIYLKYMDKEKSCKRINQWKLINLNAIKQLKVELSSLCYHYYL